MMSYRGRKNKAPSNPTKTLATIEHMRPYFVGRVATMRIAAKPKTGEDLLPENAPESLDDDEKLLWLPLILLLSYRGPGQQAQLEASITSTGLAHQEVRCLARLGAHGRSLKFLVPPVDH